MNGEYPRVCICVGFQLFRPFHLVHVVTVVLLLLYARNYIFRITRCDFLPSLSFLSTRPNVPLCLVFSQRPAFAGLGSDSSHSFAVSQLHSFSLLAIFFHRGALFQSIYSRSFLKLVLFTIARAFLHSTNQQHDNTVTSVSQHLVAHIFIRGVYTLALGCCALYPRSNLRRSFQRSPFPHPRPLVPSPPPHSSTVSPK